MSLIGKAYHATKTMLKVSFTKLFHWNHFFCGSLPYFKVKVAITISSNSTIKLANRIKLMEGVRLGAINGGILEIDDRTSINVGSIIVAHDSIRIGKDCQIGPYCLIYDHDHKFETAEDLASQEFKTKPVSIGNNVWIGANCTILRGTVIGDHCVIAAGTVVKGVYEPNTIVYEKREIMTRKIGKTKEEKA